MKIPPVPKASKLLDAAMQQTPGQASIAISTRFHEMVTGFPSFDKLDPFTTAMTKTVIDRDVVKQALGRVNGVQRTLRRFAHLPKGEFLGRLKSVLKKLDASLVVLGEARAVLRRIPDPTVSFTVCLAGFPNAGKSTLLKKLTGAGAQIANYEFTTKVLNYGTLEVRYHDVQVVDTPGTLNRAKANAIEKQALLALDYLANGIVFVYDPMRDMESQEALYKTMKAYKVPVCIYAAKQDIWEQLPTFGGKVPVYTEPQQLLEWMEPLVLTRAKAQKKAEEKREKAEEAKKNE